MGKLRFSISFLLALTFFVALYFWLNRPGEPIPVLGTDSMESPVLSITRHCGFVVESEYHAPYLEFAVWQDGTVIRRELPDEHDSQLLASKIDPKKIRNLLAALSQERLLDPHMRRSHVGPSSGYTSIEIATDQGIIELASWHETTEKSPTLVTTDFGIVAMEPGMTKKDYSDEWPRAYRLFRDNWDIIRDATNKMSRASGTPYDGKNPELRDDWH